MKPVRTKATIGTYGAPRGATAVGGLPYHRTYDETMYPGAGVKVPVIHSAWELEPAEIAALQRGGRIELAIYGEPIPPVSLIVVAPEEL